MDTTQYFTGIFAYNILMGCLYMNWHAISKKYARTMHFHKQRENQVTEALTCPG